MITSQYFLWYLSLLPLSLSWLRFTKLEAFACLSIWLATQGSWLLPAYYLEFVGSNTFQVFSQEILRLSTLRVLVQQYSYFFVFAEALYSQVMCIYE